MHIHIAILNMGWINVGLAATINQLILTHRTHRLSIVYTGLGMERRPISSNRNCIVRDCPQDADALCMIDADIVPPLNFLEAYSGEDILGLPMPIYRNGAICTGITPLDERGVQPVGEMSVVECSGVAGGVFFINRRVFGAPGLRFDDAFDDQGVLTSTEEYVYCHRARELGFRVWAHLGYPLSHIKEIDIREIWEAMTE